MSPARTRLVLCADDYAISPGVSRGILELAGSGRLSATSAMSVAPDWPARAADLARAARAEPRVAHLAVGLHLTFTGALGPLTRMPALAPAGAFPSLGRVIGAALTGRLPGSEIAGEIEAQIEAFVAACERPPAFVDGHQHVHALPGIRGPLMAALARRGWAGQVWLRDPADRPRRILARRLAADKALVVAGLAAGFAAAARRAGFATNRGFSGFSPFDPARDVGADVARYLQALGPAPLVMCHPGYLDAGDRLDAVVESRRRELDYLASDAFAALLAARGIEFVAAP